ncbi:dynamin family protein [Alkalibacillus salilacus]|uniref:Small GTP-binding protein n=1 Tax=Alkalibacillus salilacus TaxID=284582 RepID=A0ABT9VID1_9BACI|nr:dynamin family protein [Alkalibacillus salilacus]MDQ0160669.1 small GTP-binding protein [Alkalibacillus salilacus]
MTTGTQMALNLDTLFEVAKRNDEKIEQQKIMDLYQKWLNVETVIGFTGHFSAGKSSMINHILNQSILPSSPIPTSANIVEIKHGDEHVTYNLNQNRYATSSSIDMEEVHRLSKNGEEVQSLTIETDLPSLKGTTLMDTPGIDSADDQEFARTLSRVHLIDYFVYVVDYNHVQSEINFQFLYELEKKSVPYIIVVNQVDKHNAEEMTMTNYLNALRESCDVWGLNPDAIFTTSLIDIGHEYNQLDELKSYVDRLTDTMQDQLDSRIKVEVETVIDQLANRYYDEANQTLNAANEQTYQRQYDELKEQLSLLNLDQRQFITQYKQTIGKIVNEAYVMTSDTRELAKAYLESLQPKFKVGGLFSKKKTDEEKERRRDQFINQLQEKVTTEISWHIRHELIETYNQQSLSNIELKQALQQYDFQINEAILLESHNSSAEITGHYVLNYTDGLQSKLNQAIKEHVTPLLEQLFTEIAKSTEDKQEQLNEQLKEIEEHLENAKRSNQETLEKKQFIDQLKRETWMTTSDHSLLEDAIKHKEANQTKVLIDDIISDSIIDSVTSSESEAPQNQSTIEIEKIQTEAKTILSRIETMPMLTEFYDSIQKNLTQLEQQQYTVALFGAFSAGKSSFANAWVGEAILPVSPNPTTAAINKIAPPNRTREHGDVIVQFKTENTLLHQVSKVLEPITDKQFNSIEQLYSFIDKQQHNLQALLSKTDWSFVEAFFIGKQQSRQYLGESITSSVQAFEPYVTDETLSCYVEEITVYYNCDLTQQGVTLVDTPGADSIHARHTNVSMHYVRHSDLIVYVNYYNHAFARADREFLSQLGRVKSSFSLDKMFFILNAADLAKDNQELNDVKQYLSEQLQQYGIESPQIFALSSKRLNEDVSQKYSDSYAVAFFERFQQFIETDAKLLTAQTLSQEIGNLEAFIAQTVQELQENQIEQEQRIQQYEEQFKSLKQFLSSMDKTIYEQQINQQIDELIHYLNDRVMIQLNEMMKEVINPTTITQKGKRGQTQLKQAIKQLAINAENRLETEFHSTNMVLDRHFQQVLQSISQDINRFVDSETDFERLNIAEQALEDGTHEMFYSIVNMNSLDYFVSMYKDQKQFFVEQHVKTLFEELKTHVQSNLNEIQDQFLLSFKAHYQNQIELTYQTETNRYLTNIRHMIDSKAQLYHDANQANQLRELHHEII